jgi:hypothetical protein
MQKNVISKLEFLSNNLFFDFGGYLFRRLRYQILAIYVGTRVMNMTVMFLFFVQWIIELCVDMLEFCLIFGLFYFK